MRRIALGPAAGVVCLSQGAIWVASGDELRRRFRLSRIDPGTGKVTATVDLGTQQPKTLVPTAHGLWIVAGDGTALLIQA